ncbi:MAG: hypothetical protein ACAH83_17385 [Alphaproteobacteria bacterium]
MADFIKGMFTGAMGAGICGVMGAAVVGGVTALFAGPVGLAAAVGAGLFGLFGAAMGAVACGTSPGAGDWRGNWVAGLPLTAALAYGAYAACAPAAPQNEPPKNPPAVSVIFNDRATGSEAPAVAVWAHAPVQQLKASGLN